MLPTAHSCAIGPFRGLAMNFWDLLYGAVAKIHAIVRRADRPPELAIDGNLLATGAEAMNRKPTAKQVNRAIGSVGDAVNLLRGLDQAGIAQLDAWERLYARMILASA